MDEALVARVRYHIQKANFMGLKEAESTLLLGEAADAIEELSNAGSAYGRGWTLGYDAGRGESKPRWIPVTERLPEPYTWVLASAEKHEVAFNAFYDGAQWKDAVLNGLNVTHWMPLPEPPVEE